MTQPPSLARGAAQGAAWNFATVLGERAFGFVILGLLLRQIPASVVGLVAIGSAISDLARMISNSGAGEQVMASPGDADIEAGAFWSQTFVALAFMVALFAAAPWIAAQYQQPDLSLILRTMAVNVVLTSFLIVPSARLATAFQFKTLGLISLGSTISGGIVALPFAFSGHGVAALVYQRMVGIAFYALVACIVARWLPPGIPSFATLRRSLAFSWPLMQAAFVDYISLTGYVMIVGLRMSISDLGRFRIAQRLIEVLQEIAFLPARRVFLPVFVTVRDDPARRYETTRQMVDMLSLVIFAVSTVCGAAAVPIVHIMFSARWESAGPVFGILTFMAPVTALYGVINPLLTAAGQTRTVSLFAWINAASIAAAAWFAAPYGMIVLAWALAARGVIGIVLFCIAVRIGLERPAAPMLRLLALPCAGLIAGRLAAAAVMAALPAGPVFQQFCLSAGTAGIVFAACMVAAAPQRMVAMVQRLQRALRAPA